MTRQIIRAAAPLALVIITGAGAFIWESHAAAQERRNAPPASPGKVAAHPQANLPPLTLPAYQLPRSEAVVRATYKFAAEHPEVLTYVPCFCGCEQSGHKGNEDCFVKTRAKNGDVTAWNDHGMVCPMCLGVAELSMRMFNMGKPVREIRAEVESAFAHMSDTRTPTPQPPSR